MFILTWFAIGKIKGNTLYVSKAKGLAMTMLALECVHHLKVYLEWADIGEKIVLE